MRRVKITFTLLLMLAFGLTGCGAASVQETAVPDVERSTPAESVILSNLEPTPISPEPTNTPLPPDIDAPSVETTDPAVLSELLDELMAGGNIIYVRHTHTDRSRGDEDVSLGMCDKQRVLSEQGQDEALMIRNAYKQLELPVSLIVSTQYCRTLETAVLAFGVPRVMLRSDLHTTLTDWFATEPEVGTNTLIVAHIGTIRDRVGLDDTFEEGDALIYRPTGDGGFGFVGRIGLYDWPLLVELNENR